MAPPRAETASSEDRLLAYVQAFGLPRTLVLSRYAALLQRPHRHLEFSLKFAHTQMHPARFAVIYDSDIRGSLRSIVDFMDDVSRMPGVSLDIDVLAGVLRGLDLSRVDLTACGLDLRPCAVDCRMKVWLSIRDQPAKVSELIDWADVSPDMAALVRGGDLPVGIDFDFAGRSRIKLYPAYRPAEFVDTDLRTRLVRVIGPHGLPLVGLSRRANVTNEACGGATLHFQVDRFQAAPMLSRLRIDDRHGALTMTERLGLRVHVISVPHHAAGVAVPDRFNLYLI